MTTKQKEQFNRMLSALKTITYAYQTAQEILKSAHSQYGLSPAEALSYAYENIQGHAKSACKGVKELK